MRSKTGALVLLALVACLVASTQAAADDRGSSCAGDERAQHALSLVSRSQPINVSASDGDSRYPTLAVSRDSVHVVWEENERVHHGLYRGGSWSLPRSVAVGQQPAVAVDGSDRAHVAFVNLFGGNYEVYYCRWENASWTLPRNVSNTSGVSSAPALAIAPDGTPHVVWADTTPGYSVIYHGYWNGTYWLNAPIPHALGGTPAVAVGRDGTVHVAWQDRDWPDAPYEIYYSRWDGTLWSLPENLSDSEAQASLIPSVSVDEHGQAHVSWQERDDDQYAIYYTWGRVGLWSIAEKVSDGEAEAYLPSLTVSQTGTVFVGWDESTVALYRRRSITTVDWSRPLEVVCDPLGVVDLRLSVDARGTLHAVWGERTGGGRWDVFYQELSYRVALPMICRDGQR